MTRFPGSRRRGGALAGAVAAALAGSSAVPAPSAAPSAAIVAPDEPAAATGAIGLPGATGAPAPETKRFVDFLNGIYQRDIHDSPMLAATFGAKDGYDRWDDLSARAERARIEVIRADIRHAKADFDQAKLDARGRLQYRVFIGEQNLLLERDRWRDHLYPMNQIVGLHLSVPDILIHQNTIKDRADADAYIHRIEGVKALFDQFIARMRRHAAKGVLMPKLVYPLLIDQCRGVIAGVPFQSAADKPAADNPVWADFNRKIDALEIPAAAKDALRDRARTALLGSFQPAYRELIAVLEEQRAKSRIDAGVWQQPEGEAFYAFLVRQFTTTDMTPRQIHELGLREVERIHGEMQAVMDRVGFKGTLREFMARMKADPKFYYPNTDQGREAFLERARSIIDAMQAKITGDFLAPPALPLKIERPAAYREASLPAGDYEAGTPDGKVPGIIYLNLSDMRKMPTFELDDLLYHEGIPGHHMQFSTILADPTIPQLRKVNDWWQDTAFVEGWALYAERLAKDMGFYQDPYADFGRLSGELWRACRLVVDTGIHANHWSREQAIRYLDDNTPRSDSAREVDRYIAVPGQATAFMVGMKTLLLERQKAADALGSKFDIRGFHDAVLRNGFIPLWAVEESVAGWVAERQPHD